MTTAYTRRRFLARAALAAPALANSSFAAEPIPLGPNVSLKGRRPFPDDNPWNRDISADPDIRVALIRGEGKGFSAGGDLALVEDKIGRAHV